MSSCNLQKRYLKVIIFFWEKRRISSNVLPNFQILRTHIKPGTSGLKQNSDIILAQIRAIDNKRLIKKIGNLTQNVSEEIKQNLRIICGLE